MKGATFDTRIHHPGLGHGASVVETIHKGLGALHRWHARHPSSRKLSTLSARQLADIGLGHRKIPGDTGKQWIYNGSSGLLPENDHVSKYRH